MASVVAVRFGRTAIVSDTPARMKQSAVSGRMGYPPVVAFVMNERFNAQPMSVTPPRRATTLPAMIGTRSNKPINGLWRLAGLSATTLGLAMLQVDRKTYSPRVASAILPADPFKIP